MKRQRYPGYLKLMLPKLAMLALVTGLPMFAVAVYLHSSYPDSPALTVCSIAGIGLIGLLSHFLIKRTNASLPCPTCQSTNLKQSKTHDRDEWHLLTCERCGTEWMTGVGDGYAD